jgi:hypothetical protein
VDGKAKAKEPAAVSGGAASSPVNFKSKEHHAALIRDFYKKFCEAQNKEDRQAILTTAEEVLGEPLIKPRVFFSLYLDYKQHLDLLSLEEKGEVLTAIYEFVTGGSVPEMSKSAAITFSFMQAQLERDEAKYNGICIENWANGILGGRPKKEKP